tara:strand:- start:1841 stop:2032 length:192 start_codon:yes stop_codon:yes gene_type:complete
MKKLLGIIVLGFLLSGNAYAENIEIKKNFIAVNFCKDGAGYSAISYECPTLVLLDLEDGEVRL